MQPETHSTTSTRRLALCCAAVSGGVALVCAARWMFSQSHYAVLGPLSAWMMLLLSVVLFLRAGWPASRPIWLIAFGSTAIIGFTSLLILWVRFQEFDLSFERWRAEIDVVVNGVVVGRMAPLTASAFLLAAVALLCLLQPPAQWRSRGRQRLATGLALAILLIVCGIFLGYASGVHTMASGGRMSATVLTALCFAIIAVGIIALTMHGERWVCHIVGESWVEIDAKSRRFRFRLLAAFVVLVLAVGTTGSAYLRQQIARVRAATQSELSAIGSLKAEQIANWRAERLRDARYFANATFARQEVQAFLDNPSSASAKTELVRWLSLLQTVNQNSRLLLFDRELKLRLALPENAREGGPVARQHAAEALQATEPVMTDLHRGDLPGEVHLDVAFAILPPGAHRDTGTRPIAVVLLQLNPHAFLYPLLQSWPIPSATAETGLVRREGDKVLFLNNLRHRTNTALNLSFPLDHPELPAAIFLRGNAQEQLLEGIDYRGVPVLTAFRRIPDSPWVLGAKVDQEEVFATLRQQTWATIAVLLLLIAVMALTVVLLWRQRLADSLRRELGLERERKLLADRVALLMRHANDIIVLADANWKIVEANERALESYGYTLEEMRRMKISDLRAQESRGRFTAEMAVVQSQGSAVFEAVHRRKDGSSFRVEISSRTVEIDGAPYYLAITRDITERRRAESALRESENLYHSLVEHLPQAIYRLDRTGRITFANARCCEQMGCAPQELVGKSAFDLFPTDQATRYWNESRRVMETGDTLDIVDRHQRPDGRESSVHIIKSPLRGGDGQIVGLQCLLWDVTARKQAEEALRSSEARYRSLFENMLNGFAYCRMIYEGDRAVDFIFVAVNNAFETLTGLKNVVGRKASEVIPGIREKDPAVIETYGRVARTGAPEKFEVYVEAMKMWFSVSVYRPQEGYFVTVFDVITQRKEAELALRASEERLKFAMEGANDGIWDVDLRTNSVYLSPRGCEMLGYGHEEFAAGVEHWNKMVHPDDLSATQTALDHYLSGHTPLFQIEQRLKTKSGEYKWILARGKVSVRDTAGHPVRMTGTHTDITARKEAAEALRTSEELNRRTLQALPAHMAVIDWQGRIIAVNQAWTEFALSNNTAGSVVTAMGVNYLDICRRAIADNDTVAAEA